MPSRSDKRRGAPSGVSEAAVGDQPPRKRTRRSQANNSLQANNPFQASNPPQASNAPQASIPLQASPRTNANRRRKAIKSAKANRHGKENEPPLDRADEQHGSSAAAHGPEALELPVRQHIEPPRTPDPPTTGLQTDSTILTTSNSFKTKDDLKEKIGTEARGVSRKNIRRETFVERYMPGPGRSPAPHGMRIAATNIYADGFEVAKVVPKIKRMFDLGLLHLEARLPFPLALYTASSEGLNRCYEHLTKPDLTLFRTDGPQPVRPYKYVEGPPFWTEAHFIVEHTCSRSKDACREKQMQFARNAWQVFAHQPSRERLFGLVVMKEDVCWCYADHCSIVFSERFTPDEQLADETIAVLSDRRLLSGNEYKVDYTVVEKEVLQSIYYPSPNLVLRESEVLYYRPYLVGRNCRVAALSDEHKGRILKSAWEETTTKNEADIYDKLEEQGVRGILKKYWSKSDILTTALPDGKVAFSLPTNESVETTRKSFSSGMESKSFQASRTQQSSRTFAGISSASERRHDFNEPVQIQRRHVQLILPRCDDFFDFSVQQSAEEILPLFRDAILSYYETWKIGGCLQADITPYNIMRTRADTEFSHPSERKVTILDFNLCYDNADSGREQRSGSPPYMAHTLFNPRAPSKRLIGHDLESFFYILIYAFTYRPNNEEWRQIPLYDLWTTSIKALGNTKLSLFGTSRFDTEILEYLHPKYKTNDIIRCITKWQNRIFGGKLPLNMRTEEKDHEKAFKACLVALDYFLGDHHGARELQKIRRRAPNHNGR